MSKQLDHFDTQLQAEDAEFVEMMEDACYAAFLREQAEAFATEIEEAAKDV